MVIFIGPLFLAVTKVSGAGMNWFRYQWRAFLLLCALSRIAGLVGRGTDRSLLVYKIDWRRNDFDPINTINSTSADSVGASGVFSPRADAATVVFKGKIFVLGGAKESVHYNDVWHLHPSDPNLWVLVTVGGPNARRIFSPRYSHKAIMYNERIWVMGGFTVKPGASQGSLQCDVFSSTDGKIWVEHTNEAWMGKGRIEFGLLKFKGEMFVLGGYGGKGAVDKTVMNDVYSSSDGKSWLRIGNSSTITSTNRWSRRSGFGFTATSEKMFVVGGWGMAMLRDLWASEDGDTWSEITPITDYFTARTDFKMRAFDGMLWVFGGKVENGYSNEVWSGVESGDRWIKMDPSSNMWEGRDYHSIMTCQGSVFLIGGQKYVTNTARKFMVNPQSASTTFPEADVWRAYISNNPCTSRRELANPFSSCYCHNATGGGGGGSLITPDLPLWALVVIIAAVILSLGLVIFFGIRWKKKKQKERQIKIQKLGGKAGMDITKNLDKFLAKRVDNAKTPYGVKGKAKNLNAK